MLFDETRFNISEIYNVIQYSRETNTNNSYPPNLPTYELMYYIEGESTLTFGNKIINISAGDILYLPKNTNNNIYSLYVSKGILIYNIYFDTNCKLSTEPMVVTTNNPQFKLLFEKTFKAWVNKHQGYYYKSMGLMYEITELLNRMQTTYTPGNMLMKLKDSEYYMQEHYCDTNFNYNTMRELSGLSYSYFKKLFIEKYSMTPVKYVTRLKINRACELLKTQKFKISEIAELCGFENVYYFSNVFKRHMGTSPKNYN